MKKECLLPLLTVDQAGKVVLANHGIGRWLKFVIKHDLEGKDIR